MSIGASGLGVGTYVTAGYCGTGEVAGQSCGCLVTLTVGLTTRPAGKTIVNSEACPQGKW